MHWRVKGAIQKVLGLVPRGARIHDLLERRVSGNRAVDRELAMSVDDWRSMVKRLRSVGIAAEGARFVEIGTGRHPILPLCLYFSGARSVDTFDFVRQLKPESALRCAIALGRRVYAMAEATGRDPEEVRRMLRSTVRALKRGAGLDEATHGVVRYRAPAEVGATHHRDGSVDVVFSTSVLEHLPVRAIQRGFAEAHRILRPGGVMYHAARCGDHYADVDPSISQLHYLRYSNAAWAKWNNAFLFQNRLRAVDFTTMSRGAGFVIELDTSHVAPGRLTELAAIDVHPEFSRYTRDQLAVTSVDFIARKASAAEQAA
jgi:SAM-dependent methyltransferase